MENLKNTIFTAQNVDKNALLEVITFFDPLIKKYVKLMDYDEDFKSELTIYLMELINSMKLSDFRILNDFTIINYVRTSVYHEYIFLSKKRNEIVQHETYYETEDLNILLGEDYRISDKLDDLLIDELLRCSLTKCEYICFNLVIIEGYSSSQASKTLGISRQAVNSSKNRAIKKLRNNIKSDYTQRYKEGKAEQQ